jgi:hypothetical protein
VARQLAVGHRHPGGSQPDNQWIQQIDVLRGGAKPDQLARVMRPLKVRM